MRKLLKQQEALHRLYNQVMVGQTKPALLFSAWRCGLGCGQAVSRASP